MRDVNVFVNKISSIVVVIFKSLQVKGNRIAQIVQHERNLLVINKL